MKKPLAKQIIVGTMALTLIGASGYLLKGQNALAATDAAATATSSPTGSPQTSTKPDDDHALGMIKRVNDQLLAFLKLDKSAFQTKVAAGETLAQIATDQGISRDALKTELTTEANTSFDKEKADFALNIDKTVDSKLNLGGRGGHGGPEGHGGPGGHGGPQTDLATATALGYTTAAELQAALVKGTSIADLAAAKGVTLQTVIDLQVTALVKDLDEDLAAGEITQSQYDTQKSDVTARATSIVNDKHDGTGDFGGRGGKNHKGGRPDVNKGKAAPSASAAPSATPSATTAS